jgi:hypothetical protein
LHALDEAGVAQDAARFEQVAHLGCQFVDGRIRCRQPIEGAPEFQHTV